MGLPKEYMLYKISLISKRAPVGRSPNIYESETNLTYKGETGQGLNATSSVEDQTCLM